MARMLVLSCDGTWQTAADATNVRRLHDALARTPTQLPQYFSGVGTLGNPLARLLDGVVGTGLGETVRVAYRWVADTWEPGDRLVLLGFSRGAFTVRSLVGMLTTCGLAAFGDSLDDAARDRIVDRVWTEGYRRRRPAPGVAVAPGFGPGDVAPIDFLGVWDTVGALGVPRTLGLLSTLVGHAQVAFHDTTLDPDVRHARQALALDERRGPYVPGRWATPAPGVHESFAQLWFPGGHGDVGGGEASRGLSDGALRWMAEELTRTVAPVWTDDPGDPARLPGDPTAPGDDVPGGLYRYLSPRPRGVPHVVPGAPDVHPSAVARRAAGLVPPYRPGVVPEAAPLPFAVPAGEPWAETGLYLPPGRWRVEPATPGQTWRAWGAAVPITGARRWPVRTWPAWGLGTVLDGVRRAVRSVSSVQADVVGSRRVPAARWMQLVLVVADARAGEDGTVGPHTTVPLVDDGVELDLTRGGYLYAFANEAWTGYGHLDGAAALRARRVTAPS